MITRALALALVLAGAPSALAQDAPFAGIPPALAKLMADQLDGAKELKYFPPKHYDDLLAQLAAVKTVDQARAMLRAMAQLSADHDSLNGWFLGLANQLRIHAAFGRAVGAEAWPKTLTLDKLSLEGDLVLLGTGGPLWRRWPSVDRKRIGDQRYLEPNLGVDGHGNWWIAGQQIRRAERVDVPPPKAFCAELFGATVDARGTLSLDGNWLRPPAIQTKRETITLTPVRITMGSTLWRNDDLGIQVNLSTARFPGLAKAAGWTFVETDQMGWAGDPEPPETEPAIARIAARLKARLAVADPKTIDWPTPFAPDAARARAVLPKLDALLARPDGLLRVRMALLYGDTLPADTDPATMLATERAVRAALTGGDQGGDAGVESRISRAAAGVDWRLVAAAVRHAPGEPAPKLPADGKLTLPGGQWAHVQFPPDYSPWRRAPLLVVLHGQYGRPDYDFSLWKDLAARAGMILACPKFGLPSGAPRTYDDDWKVLAIVRHLCLNYAVDCSRIYLTGISMGGAKSWSLASTYPGRWAAVAPEAHGPIWKLRYKKSGGGHETKYLLLDNLVGLPLHVMESQFDGLNTIHSRAARDRLQARRSPLVYYEAGLTGHNRTGWRYPHLVGWFAERRRPRSPSSLTLRALHAWQAERAWLAIRKLTREGAWRKRDGAFSRGDLAAVEAKWDAKRRTITLRATRRKARVVELFYDPELMAGDGPIAVRAGSRKASWLPRPSGAALLRRALATGERDRLYPDALTFKLRR